MKRLFTLFLSMIFFFSSISVAYPVSWSGDLEDLPSEARKAILDFEQKKNEDKKREKEEKNVTVKEQVEIFEQYGTAVGKALNAMIKELGITLNEFVITPVGKLTTAVLLWKLVIYEMFRMMLRIAGAVVAAFVIVMSFIRFHVPHKIKTKLDNGKEQIEYMPKYTFRTNDARWGSVAVHLVLGVLTFVVYMLLV